MTRRRGFLKAAMGAGAGLVIPIALPRVALAEGPATAFRPSVWLAIDSEGIVTVTLARVEMGQGVRTALPMILADELDVELSRVRLVHASPGPDFDDLGTGGSDSVMYHWRRLRTAGAAAREMLVATAAETWHVAPTTCRTRQGFVVHEASGRKLGYGDLTVGASKRAVPKEPRLKEPAERAIVGTSVRRLDGRDIVSGRAVFGVDVRIPNLRYATVVRPPRLGATAARWDGARAKQVSGVRSIVQVPSGIAVVADDTWAAMKGAEALDVSWKDGEASSFSSDRSWADLDRGAEAKSNVTRREGEPEAALGAASGKLEAVYRYPIQAHAAMEPMSYTAHAEPSRCRLVGGTQQPQRVQRDVARALGLAEDKIAVEVTLVGGGFGRRLRTDYATEAAEVSRAAGGPVQVVWTRRDDLRHGHFQPASVHRMAAALDASGRPLAWFHRKASSGHSTSPPTPEEQKDPAMWRDLGWGQHDVPYAFPSILTEYSYVPTPVPGGPWRAVFAPPSAFARESFLDEIAHAAGKDPLAFRLELLPAGTSMKSGDVTIARDRLRRVLEVAAEKAGWGSPLPKVAGRRYGRGIACNAFHGVTHVAQIADVSVGADGDVKVHRVVCAVDCGVPVNPLGIEGQVESGVLWGLTAALKGEITFTRGAVDQSNYADYPILRLSEAPDVDVHIVPSGDRPFGLGEAPVPPAAPAVTNAIFAATGRRIRRLPIRAVDLA